jgi:hypothetical protein
MKSEFLRPKYYNQLDTVLDREFLRDPKRPYISISGLVYRGEPVAVAIPLRANINRLFQSDADMYVATPATDHTRSENISGWHVTKLIPSHRAMFYNNVALADTTAESLTIANMQLKKLRQSAQSHLTRIEKGIKVFGAIDFDRALAEMDKLLAADKAAQLPTPQRPAQPVAPEMPQAEGLPLRPETKLEADRLKALVDTRPLIENGVPLTPVNLFFTHSTLAAREREAAKHPQQAPARPTQTPTPIKKPPRGDGSGNG